MMKKILLATTALVATGMIAGQAVAAEKLKVSVGGTMVQWVGFGGNDSLAAKAQQTIVASGAVAASNQVNRDTVGLTVYNAAGQRVTFANATARNGAISTTAAQATALTAAQTALATAQETYSAAPSAANLTALQTAQTALEGAQTAAGTLYNVPAVAARDKLAQFDTQSSSELYFRGSTKLDNGLTVAVRIDLETDAGQNSNTDDSFLSIGSDSMGTLTLGQTKHIAYDIQQSAPDVGIGVADGDVAHWIIKPSVGTFSNDHGMPGVASTDSNKIVYASPSLGGLTIGASYAPDNTKHGSNGPRAAEKSQVWTAGLIYSGTFNDFGVTFDAGMGRVKNNQKVSMAGLKVSYAGFTFGGGYVKTTDDRETKTDPGSPEAKSYSVGVSYAMDAMQVSLGYGSTKVANTTYNVVSAAGVTPVISTGFKGDDTSTTIMLSAAYAFGPGVKFKASVFQQDYEGEDTTTKADDNSGLGVVAGLSIDF